jgi:hypothetical protein
LAMKPDEAKQGHAQKSMSRRQYFVF